MINQIHTSCKNCIFAEYEGDRQISCNLGKIEKYKNTGAEIIEAYDNEKEFYVINKRICSTCRNTEWGNKSSPDKWKERLDKEIEIKYGIIVLNKDDINIDETIQSIVAQKIQPSYLHIVNLSRNDKVYKRISKLLDRIQTNIKWKVEQPLVGLEYELKYVDRLYNNGHIRDPFYAVMYNGDTIKPDFFNNLNCRIHDDLTPCVALVTDEITVFSTPIHSFLDGNKGANLIDKIKEQEPEAVNYE